MAPTPLAQCASDNPVGLFFADESSDARELTVAPSPAEVMRAVPGPWQLDEEWLQGWLGQSSDPNRTPFLGLHRLLPGQQLIRTPSGRPAIRNTIGPEVWGRPDLDAREAPSVYAAAFTLALERLIAASPVITCELSAGLDSTYTVASLADRLQGSGTTIRAYCLSPHPDATLPPSPRLTSEAALAGLVAEAYPATVRFEVVCTDAAMNPLTESRRMSALAKWPVYGQTTLGGFADIRRRAAAHGSAFVWTSAHGNAAFSRNVPYLRDQAIMSARALRKRCKPPQPGRFLRTAAVPPLRQTRHHYLEWLAGHTDLNAAVQVPGVVPAPRRDPFRAPEVLEVASRMKPDAWRRQGMNRGFARDMGSGLVPAEIRLNRRRGLQGADAWFTMYRHHLDYIRHVELLAATPLLQNIVDVAAVRSAVVSWPWGQASPSPPLGELALVSRILAFAQFIADAKDWLATGLPSQQRSGP